MKNSRKKTRIIQIVMSNEKFTQRKSAINKETEVQPTRSVRSKGNNLYGHFLFLLMPF